MGLPELRVTEVDLHFPLVVVSKRTLGDFWSCLVGIPGLGKPEVCPWPVPCISTSLVSLLVFSEGASRELVVTKPISYVDFTKALRTSSELVRLPLLCFITNNCTETSTDACELNMAHVEIFQRWRCNPYFLMIINSFLPCFIPHHASQTCIQCWTL